MIPPNICINILKINVDCKKGSKTNENGHGRVPHFVCGLKSLGDLVVVSEHHIWLQKRNGDFLNKNNNKQQQNKPQAPSICIVALINLEYVDRLRSINRQPGHERDSVTSPSSSWCLKYLYEGLGVCKSHHSCRSSSEDSSASPQQDLSCFVRDWHQNIPNPRQSGIRTLDTCCLNWREAKEKCLLWNLWGFSTSVVCRKGAAGTESCSAKTRSFPTGLLEFVTPVA